MSPILRTVVVLAVVTPSLSAQEIAWTDIRTLGVEGRGFEKT